MYDHCHCTQRNTRRVSMKKFGCQCLCLALPAEISECQWNDGRYLPRANKEPSLSICEPVENTGFADKKCVLHIMHERVANRLANRRSVHRHKHSQQKCMTIIIVPKEIPDEWQWVSMKKFWCQCLCLALPAEISESQWRWSMSPIKNLRCPLRTIQSRKHRLREGFADKKHFYPL